MEIAISDLKHLRKKHFINKNKNYMFETMLHAKDLNNNNKYLSKVVDEYKKHYVDIKKEKMDQYNALQNLSEYIDKITSESNITEQLLRESISDQKQIMRTMKDIENTIKKLNKALE